MPKTTTTTPNKTHYDGPRGLFALDLEPVEGRPSLSRVSVTIIDGTACRLIYDAAIRRMANTPTWKQIENMEGLREGLQALLKANGLAVPTCMDCEYTIREQGTDDKRKCFGCPVDRTGGAVGEGCKAALCPHFRELSDVRRKEEKQAREDEIKAAKEAEEMERLEELERKELRRLRRKHGRDSEED